MFQGRFAPVWSDTQQRHHERVFPAQQYSSDLWQVGLIQKIWDQEWCQIWKHRNEDLHGKDALSCQTAERLDVQRQLNLIYAHRPAMMETPVQALLLSSAEAHAAYPLNVTKNWL